MGWSAWLGMETAEALVIAIIVLGEALLLLLLLLLLAMLCVDLDAAPEYDAPRASSTSRN